MAQCVQSTHCAGSVCLQEVSIYSSLSEDNIKCLLPDLFATIFFKWFSILFQEERFQMVFDLAQELIDEDYHRADVISAR